MLKREHVIQVLKKHKAELYENYGVTKLGIFGSVACNKATKNSDLDLVIKMIKPDLFMMGSYQKSAGARVPLPC